MTEAGPFLFLIATFGGMALLIGLFELLFRAIEARRIDGDGRGPS